VINISLAFCAYVEMLKIESVYDLCDDLAQLVHEILCGLELDIYGD
jgi:hypothetical protein